VMETAPILLLLAMLIGVAVAAGPIINLMEATAAELHQPGHYLNSVLGAERVPPFAEREDR